MYRCKLAWTLVGVGIVACGGGCADGDIGRMSGRITYRGQPVTQGAVLFENSEQGVSVNAVLGKNGEFAARTHDQPGLPPGTYRVAVSPRTFGDGSAPLVVDPSATESAKSPIPEKYHQTSTSGLTVEILAGANPPLNIELEE